MATLSPRERLEHMAEMYDAYGYGDGLDNDMDNYGYGVMVGGKSKRKPTAYNKFVGKKIKQGKSLSEAARLWKKEKKSSGAGTKKSSGSKTSAKKSSRSKTSVKKSSSKTKSKESKNPWIKCRKELGNRGLDENTISQAYYELNCRVDKLEKLVKSKLPKLK